MNRKLRLLACMLAVGLAFMASPTQAHAEWISYDGAISAGFSTVSASDAYVNAMRPLSGSDGNRYYTVNEIFVPGGYGDGDTLYGYIKFEFRNSVMSGRKCLIHVPSYFARTLSATGGKVFVVPRPTYQYYVGNTWVDFEVDNDGGFVVPDGGIYAIRVKYEFVPISNGQNSNFVISLSRPSCLFDVPAEAANEVARQTTEIMDTSGSESVLDGPLEGGESALTDRLGFVGEAMSIPNAFFSGVTSDADSVVHFPGISVMGFNVPAADVDIWSALPNLETPCKTICTFVFIVAWFRGIQAIYGRIVQGDKVVTIEGVD